MLVLGLLSPCGTLPILDWQSAACELFQHITRKGWGVQSSNRAAESSLLLQARNDTYASSLQELLARPGAPVDDVLFISVDRLGANVRVWRVLRRLPRLCFCALHE